MKETGPLIKAFQSHRLQAESPTVTSETGFELLCTYNWALIPAPSIYVPGMLTNFSVVGLDGRMLILIRCTSILGSKGVADVPT
jgi:hypothetical protein